LNIRPFATLPTAITAATLAGAIGLLSAAPAAAQPVPSYASGSSDETIHGTVAAVNGRYSITVRDARGFLDNVTLHRGTIINPTGLSLAPGQAVTILGRNEGSTFAANEIDTPYALYPAYGYYGYPYPYGFGPVYRVGLRFGRGFGFGFGG
jgi:hypothetical protein